MKDIKILIQECTLNSECLEKTANLFSLTYILCIIISIIIGITLLGKWVNDELLNFIVGSVGLLATIIPLVFKNNIEKIQGYRELSIEFKNLEQDLLIQKNKKKRLDNLKRLRRRLCDYPINGYAKWLIQRKNIETGLDKK